MTISRKLVALAAALVALVAGSFAFAGIPDVGGVVHTCYVKTDGKLRVIDSAAGQTCKSTENALDIDQKGPKGDPGPQGMPGVSGLTRMAAVSPMDSGSPKQVSVACPAGKVQVGGGASILSGTGTSPIALTTSFPSAVGTEGWIAGAREIAATSESWQLVVLVNCADAS